MSIGTNKLLLTTQFIFSIFISEKLTENVDKAKDDQNLLMEAILSIKRNFKEVVCQTLGNLSFVRLKTAPLWQTQSLVT